MRKCTKHTHINKNTQEAKGGDDKGVVAGKAREADDAVIWNVNMSMLVSPILLANMWRHLPTEYLTFHLERTLRIDSTYCTATHLLIRLFYDNNTRTHTTHRHMQERKYTNVK